MNSKIAILLASTCLISASAHANDALQGKIKALEAKVGHLEQAMHADQNARAKMHHFMPTAPQMPFKITMNAAPTIESADGKFSFGLHGYAQSDVASFHKEKTKRHSGVVLRNAVVNVSGNIEKYWYYVLETNMAFSPKITYAFIEHNCNKNVKWTFGQTDEPFNREQLESYKYTTFLEKGSVNAFAPQKNIGIMGTYMAPNFTVAVGAFGNNSNTTNAGDTQGALTGRATFTPIIDKDKLIHLGVAASLRKPEKPAQTVRFQERPETRIASFIVDTGAMTNVRNYKLFGFEAAAAYGPFSIISEYATAKVDKRNTFNDPKFDSFYIQGAYILTGEMRGYDSNKGIFTAIKPKTPFSPKGGTGAWEIAARYNDIDLNDVTKGVAGGHMQNFTTALNWYANNYVRFSFNYVVAKTDGHGIPSKNRPRIALFRTQFAF